jgi:hypothetical protein
VTLSRVVAQVVRSSSQSTNISVTKRSTANWESSSQTVNIKMTWKYANGKDEEGIEPLQPVWLDEDGCNTTEAAIEDAMGIMIAYVG